MRLGVLTSHPIQYQAPLFRALAERIDLRVYFAHKATGLNQADAGFDVGFEWDIDLTSGFQHTFLDNVSKQPGITKFAGGDTPSIGHVLKADRVDILAVYGWHLKAYLQATKAAHSLRIPVMARTDSILDTPRSAVKRAAMTVIYPFFLRRFDMFLAAGSRAAQYLRHYRLPESRIRIVPYCIDVQAFSPAAQLDRASRESLRAKLGVGPDERVVLFVGKLVARKCVPDLIEALSRLAASGRRVRLLVVGSGSLEAELVAMAERRSLAATFIGFVNQSRIPEVYAAGDVLVLPSIDDTWGLVVNEAFACGVPAIVSDRVGCGPDMIVDGVTGTVVPLGDIGALARALDYWTGAPDGHGTRRALSEITGQYSPGSSADAFVGAAVDAASGYRKGSR